MTGYKDELRRIRSAQLVSTLKKRGDVAAKDLIASFTGHLQWKPLESLSIHADAWKAVDGQYDPKMVFCHPDLLLAHRNVALYYRGLCGLSIKSAKDYVGAIESLEAGNPRARLDPARAAKISRTYNEFISFVIRSIPGWTLEDGSRTVVATIGITVDGSSRGGVGKVAETRIKTLLLEKLIAQNLLVDPRLTADQLTSPEGLPRNVYPRAGYDDAVCIRP